MNARERQGQEQAWGKGRLQLPGIEGHLSSRCGAEYFTYTISELFTTLLL